MHDNCLRSYEVSNERTDVLFAGVEAYHFEYDCFGNIVFGIEEIPTGDLLARQRQACQEGFRLSGWPRFWSGSYEKAVEYIHQRSLHGYEVTSSYGIYGWVLARSMTYIAGNDCGG